MLATCPACGGHGYSNNPHDDHCRWCGGVGTVPQSEVEEYAQWLRQSAPPPLTEAEMESIRKECGF